MHESIEQTVFIVDDEIAILDALQLVMKSADLKTEVFSNAQEFLDAYNPDKAGCLVLDIRMPNMNGMDLQKKLNEKKSILPIIFITGHGNVNMAVEAMKDGAIEFIQKPFQNEELLNCINKALKKDAKNRHELQKKQSIIECLKKLTPREKEVLNKVVAGSANKVIAFDLGISQRTVEIHRANIMQKMQIKSLANLIKTVLSVK